MKASNLIKELQERIELYGDLEVSIRVGFEDEDLRSVFGDESSDRIIVSDFPDPDIYTENQKNKKAISLKATVRRQAFQDEEIEFSLTDENIDEIIYTAFEGGITYWCGRVTSVGDLLGDYNYEQISRGGQLILHDLENGEEYTLTKEKFLTGIVLYVENTYSGCLGKLNPGDETWIFESINGELRVDPGCIDSEIADAIIQYALFENIIFG